MAAEIEDLKKSYTRVMTKNTELGKHCEQLNKWISFLQSGGRPTYPHEVPLVFSRFFLRDSTRAEKLGASPPAKSASRQWAILPNQSVRKFLEFLPTPKSIKPPKVD